MGNGQTFPLLGLPEALALLLLQWWGPRAILCYLFATLPFSLIPPIPQDIPHLQKIIGNLMALGLSAFFFNPKRGDKCWLPDLKNTLGFFIRGILIPYSVSRIAMVSLSQFTSTPPLFERLQTDFTVQGTSFFLLTLPALLILTPSMEKWGWSRTSGAVTPSLGLSFQGHWFKGDTLLLYAAALFTAPFFIPFHNGWYILACLPLWAGIISTPALVSITISWSLTATILASALLHATSPSWGTSPELMRAACTGYLFIGISSFLLSATLNSQKHQKYLKKKLDIELNHSLNTLMQAILSTPEATVISRLNDGMVLDINPMLRELIGFNRDEVVGRHTTSMNLWVSSEDRKNWVEAIRENDEIQGYEVDLRQKSGKVAPYVLTSRLFPLNGEPCIITSLRLNTEKKEMEKELMQSRALYKEAQSIARLGHWKLDVRTGELSWSEETFYIFGLPQETKPSYALFLSMIHPEDVQAVKKAYNASIQEQKPYETIHRLLTRSGEIKYVHERGRTEYDVDGTPMLTVGTVQDITRLKEAELEKEKTLTQLRQSQKLQSIGTLTSGIAHDFNNILSAILGYTDISLQPPPENPQLRENLVQIQQAGERARDLVKQLLTFGKSDKQIKGPVKIKKLLGEVIPLIRASLPATIEIQETMESDAIIMADATQLHQVIMNLCTNASHAMKEKGGLLNIILQETAVDDNFTRRFVDMPPGDYLKLTISDTGHGMDPTTRERIFDPFFTTKGQEEGTGLGLSVVHGIVASHGGQIMVYSEPGIGTSFSLFFPLVSDDQKGIKNKIKSFKASIPQGKNQHLLVVDDEKPLVDLLDLMLTALGYRVTGFTSPTKALEVFTENPESFHAIITDLTMPGLTGTDLIREIRLLAPEVPIVLCSGFPDGITQALSEASGPVRSLLKPVDRRTLAMTLQEALNPSPS
ncbi:MAG: ATP-binding protein [Desulfobacterales bacterium]|nr:ATP-binding protein [Desulfobacterales bacterium]